MAKAVDVRYPSISKQIIIIVGGFGSGKTEVAVNLVRYLAATENTPVTIADLDLVNPYFRSREAISEMKALGVDLIAPRGGQFYADLPILLPELKGAIESHQGRLVLDVGGDVQGTKALGSIADAFKPDEYEMLMVLNSRRPQTSNIAGSIDMMKRIESTAKLKFTGLISNSHMIDETSYDIIKEGYNLATEVHVETGLPLAFISIMDTLINRMDTGNFDCAILPLTRSMLKPWERKAELGKESQDNRGE